MNGAEVLDVGRDAIWLTIQLCLPVLLVGLVVGVVIGIIQAATSVSEQTLTFVPKLIVIALVLVIMGASMMGLVADFTTQIFDEIAGLGR